MTCPTRCGPSRRLFAPVNHLQAQTVPMMPQHGSGECNVLHEMHVFVLNDDGPTQEQVPQFFSDAGFFFA